MTVRLDREFTEALNDPASPEYQELESRIRTVVSVLLS